MLKSYVLNVTATPGHIGFYHLKKNIISLLIFPVRHNRDMTRSKKKCVFIPLYAYLFLVVLMEEGKRGRKEIYSQRSISFSCTKQAILLSTPSEREVKLSETTADLSRT